MMEDEEGAAVENADLACVLPRLLLLLRWFIFIGCLHCHIIRMEFFDVAFSDNPDKKKQMTSGLNLLEQEDVADAIMFAINSPWRMNVSMIELTPTEQVPGGSIINKVE